MRIFCLFYDNFQVALQSSYFQGWFRQMYVIKFYKSLLCLFNLETYRHISFAKSIRSFFGQIQMLIQLVYHNRLLCSFWELLCNNREVRCSSNWFLKYWVKNSIFTANLRRSLELPQKELTNRWEICSKISKAYRVNPSLLLLTNMMNAVIKLFRLYIWSIDLSYWHVHFTGILNVVKHLAINFAY